MPYVGVATRKENAVTHIVCMYIMYIHTALPLAASHIFCVVKNLWYQDTQNGQDI